MEGTKPYKFIGFGAMEGTKPYKFIGFGAMEGPFKDSTAVSAGPGVPVYVRSPSLTNQMVKNVLYVMQ